ncbi:MAG: hypothetical protein Q8P30_00745 [Candidatus Uhrbacteria bacterium]|nr:hypothetical protein [Candidatus Uhrbacteria bacterium]
MVDQPINSELKQIESEYNREVAIVKARPFLKRLGIFLWTAIDVILVVLFVGYIATYLVSGFFAEREDIAAIVSNIDVMHAISADNAAQAISIGSVKEFALSNGDYDLYVEVDNPNSDWYAEFNYYFDTGSEESDRMGGYIMPNERKPLVAFRQAFDARPSDAELVVEDFVWKRVDAHAVENINDWMAEHTDFEITADDYSDIPLDGENIARSSFTIKNKTPYSYWSPVFYVVLERNGTVLGVNQASVAGFESGETRTVNVNWFGNAPTAGDVFVIENINFFDPDVYMPPPGESGSDIRDEF